MRAVEAAPRESGAEKELGEDRGWFTFSSPSVAPSLPPPTTEVATSPGRLSRIAIHSIGLGVLNHHLYLIHQQFLTLPRMSPELVKGIIAALKHTTHGNQAAAATLGATLPVVATLQAALNLEKSYRQTIQRGAWWVDAPLRMWNGAIQLKGLKSLGFVQQPTVQANINRVVALARSGQAVAMAMGIAMGIYLLCDRFFQKTKQEKSMQLFLAHAVRIEAWQKENSYLWKRFLALSLAYAGVATVNELRLRGSSQKQIAQVSATH